MAIERVAVLGAGVMGGGIAAHLANAGFQVLLLDRVPEGATGKERNRLAAAALEGMARGKAGLYVPSFTERISTGNLEDDLQRIGDCDWVIEAVLEDMAVKKRVLTELVPHLGEAAVLSTNTSGLSVEEMAAALPHPVQRRFLATHFFNPPRHMRLVEVVPCASAAPAVVGAMTDLLRRRLGKGVVRAKDTPNFIANRVGVYSMMNAFRHMAALGLGVEEVDAVAGPATARPGSALFRLADLIGLDTLVQVAENSHALLAGDDEREVFAPPEPLRAMVAKGLLGNKARQGFYRSARGDGRDVRLVWNLARGEYEEERRPPLEAIAAARRIEDPGARLRAIFAVSGDPAEFAWRNLRDTLLYAYKRLPEIAEDVVAVDEAMRWGFGWELGPFEMMDAMGVPALVARAERDGVAVPAGLRDVARFHADEGGRRTFLDLASGSYRPVPEVPRHLDLSRARRAGAVVDENASASVLSLGDGVFCFELHTRKLNAMDADAVAMLERALRVAERDGLGLVLANHGRAFSAGADLALLAADVEARAFDRVDRFIAGFQHAMMAVKYAPVPVVAAPHGMALGGGCEIVLHADAVVAHPETYMGLVELRAGLLPAGGGTKELALRAIRLAGEYRTDVGPFLARSFEHVVTARVSGSADEAWQMGFLRAGDSVTFDPDARIHDAKLRVLALAANYRPPARAVGLAAPGRSAAAALAAQLYNQRIGGFITEYDERIGRAVAGVLTGGDVAAGALVTENRLLELEREALLSLCGDPRTLARIRHVLDTGKPLRN
jgi:3-hydroxyacyl-CoA dehydrogenase